MRDAILRCARKPTGVSLMIYRIPLSKSRRKLRGFFKLVNPADAHGLRSIMTTFQRWMRLQNGLAHEPCSCCNTGQVKWLHAKTASEMTYIASSGALNSTPTNHAVTRAHPLALWVNACSQHTNWTELNWWWVPEMNFANASVNGRTGIHTLTADWALPFYFCCTQSSRDAGAREEWMIASCRS